VVGSSGKVEDRLWIIDYRMWLIFAYNTWWTLGSPDFDQSSLIGGLLNY